MSTLILSENISSVFGLSTDNGIFAASLYNKLKTKRQFLWLIAMLSGRSIDSQGNDVGGEPLVVGHGSDSELIRYQNGGFEVCKFVNDYLEIEYYTAKKSQTSSKYTTATFPYNKDNFVLTTKVVFDADLLTYAQKEAYHPINGSLEFIIVSRGVFTNRSWYKEKKGFDTTKPIICTWMSPEVMMPNDQSIQSFVKVGPDGSEHTTLTSTCQGTDCVIGDKTFSLGKDNRLLARQEGGYTTVCSYEDDLLVKTKTTKDGVRGANYHAYAEFTYLYDEDDNPNSGIFQITKRTYTCTIDETGKEVVKATSETRFNFGCNDVFFRLIHDK